MELALQRSLLPKNRLALIVDSPEGVRFCCIQCPAKYDDKEKLEVHLCTHFKEYRFLCFICGTGLKRKEHLDRHLLGHQEIRPHICSECGKGFKRKEHLNIHRAIHSGDKNQVCPLCQRSFYRKDHLQKHLQTHNKLFIEQNIFPVSDQELREIKQEILDEDVKPVLTEEQQAEVMQMVETVQINPPVDKERPFACPVCYKTYKRRDHLKLHGLTHMKKDKICSECGRAFHKEEQLLSHISVHLKSYSTADEDMSIHDIQDEPMGIPILPVDPANLLAPRLNYKSERPHECPICHRKFKRKQHLKVHANVHLKIQQPILAPTIWCSLCQEGFHNNSQFENHHCLPSGSGDVEEDQVHTNTPADAKKENNYPEFIEVIDDNMTYMNQPIISLLEEQNIPTPQRVYVCKFCSKPFKRKDHYKIHLHIHTGIKSFFCSECGKGFYRKDHLQKHEQVHQKNKKSPGTKSKKALPDLFPIKMMPNTVKRPGPSSSKDVKPEITITAPSNTKLRVPLQIKVPYQMVVAMDNGEQHAVTIEPHSGKAQDVDA
ncbi:zinc finger protein 605-like isoform X2 [Hyposmocoma kahamanoa]|uniref:zinc finger protein 605-like isoform X2 n=1 Tax=Hyposmocoma kahamanoa TaxID=1477025 RepID=UPI000E6D6803|nr:zinc finger protein 605-like isoform X2 [Hyposmocoma kahamanoa]